MRPALPTPISFPSRSVVDGTPEAITSTTRLVFSSITDVITAWPHIRMLMYRIIIRIIASRKVAPWSSRSPVSETRIRVSLASRVRSLTFFGSSPAAVSRRLTSTRPTVPSRLLRSPKLLTLRP